VSGARDAGEAIALAAEALARIWRSARVEAPPEVFPGAIDGVVASFVAAVGEALVMGRVPAEAWARTEGLVRLDPRRETTEAALDAEARLVGEVLASTCEALHAPAEVADFAARATEALRQALAGLLADAAPPPGVVTVTVLSGFRPRGASRR
jgi:hypothetical protein